MVNLVTVCICLGKHFVSNNRQQAQNILIRLILFKGTIEFFFAW